MPRSAANVKPFPRTGLWEVYSPERPEVDLIFIHGLQGDPIRTFLWNGEPRTPLCPDVNSPDVTRCNTENTNGSSFGVKVHTTTAKEAFNSQILAVASSQNKKEKNRGVFWPLDLIPNDFPSVRVLLFGYDSKITKGFYSPVNQNSISGHSRDLLCALKSQISRDRPLIFLAHSLGGLIVKEMLCQAKRTLEDPDNRRILYSTNAILFFGTPHRGSPRHAIRAESARRLASNILRCDSNGSILNWLGDNSPELDEAHKEFLEVKNCYDVRVKSFQEAFGLTSINAFGLNSKVVPDSSSTIGVADEQIESIQANHREMCKFSHPYDPEYLKVKRTMQTELEEIEKWKDKRFIRCLESLDFKGIGATHAYIATPEEGTCDWVFNHPKYMNWIDGNSHHSKVLYIKAGQGTGKSVLMKEIYRRLQITAPATTAVLQFFFHAGGNDLERNCFGLVRSLVRQWMQRDEAFAKDVALKFLDNLWEQFPMGPAGFSRSNPEPDVKWMKWEENGLKELLIAAAERRPGSLTVLVLDGIDECDPSCQEQFTEFLRYLQDRISQRGADLRICISGRPSEGPLLPDHDEIEMEVENKADIAHFTNRRMSSFCGSIRISQPGNSAKASGLLSIEEEFSRRASTNFLWRNLVTNMVLDDWKNGMKLADLLSALKATPLQLPGLFKSLFLRLTTQERRRALTLFQIIVFTHVDLSPTEACLMLGISSHHYTSIEEWESSDMATSASENAKNLIRRLSCGLIEISADAECHSKSKLMIVHESVRQYLLSGGFSELDEQYQSSNPSTLGHYRVVRILMRLLHLKEFCRQGNSSDRKDKYIGLHFYAELNLLRHLDKCGNSHTFAINLGKTLVSTRRDMWKRLVLPDEGLSSFCTTHETTWKGRCQTPLQAACILGLPLLAEQLLRSGADPNEAPDCGDSPLILATQKSPASLSIVTSLLEAGADPNRRGHHGRTALHISSSLGLEAVADVLLGRGAILDIKSEFDETPLHFAVENRQIRVAKKLLDRGADPDVWWERHTEDSRYSIMAPLHIAVANGDFEMSRTLVEANACLEIYDNAQRIPYEIAAEGDHLKMRDFIWGIMTEEGISDEVENRLAERRSQESKTGAVELDPLSLI